MNGYIAKYSLDLLLSRCYEMNQTTFLKILNLIHGKVQLIQIFSNRHDGITRSLFDINGNYIESRSMFKSGPNILPIYNLNEIIEFVETLTFNLDFVRVDIYIIKNRPLFGELTHYPGSGHSPMDYNLDLSLGRLWT